MRLGAYECEVFKNTKSYNIYSKYQFKDRLFLKNGNLLIKERHRHRYEFNNQYLDVFLKRKSEKKFLISGLNPQKKLVEIIELKNHPFFVATQFHPEFKSRPLRPHPLFLEFIKKSYVKK